MRSRWSRSIITTSAPARPSRRSSNTSAPIRVRAGRHQRRRPDQPDAVLHPAEQQDVRPRDAASGRCRRRSPPSAGSAVPLRRRMVSASSSAWVGCSCRPSPAFSTAQLTLEASRLTAPDDGCRTTSRSGCMAFSVIAVSISVSPFFTEDAATAHVHHVGAEPLAGELEARLGAGRGLEEHVDLGEAPERVGALVGGRGSAPRSSRRGPAPPRCRRGRAARCRGGGGARTRLPSGCVPRASIAGAGAATTLAHRSGIRRGPGLGSGDRTAGARARDRRDHRTTLATPHLAALAWQIELGADEAIGEAPVSRFDVPEPAPAPQPAPAPRPVAAAPAPAPAAEAAGAAALAAACADLAALRAAMAAFDGCALKQGAQQPGLRRRRPAGAAHGRSARRPAARRTAPACPSSAAPASSSTACWRRSASRAGPRIRAPAPTSPTSCPGARRRTATLRATRRR